MIKKPCPWCGGVENVSERRAAVEGICEVIQVFCRGCSLSGPCAVAKDAAIEAWNRLEIGEEKAPEPGTTED